MIPPPPAPPAPVQPPAPKIAGPLTVECQPKDCAVVVEDKFAGYTAQNRKTINGLQPGEATVQVFSDDYEHISRKVMLAESKPANVSFVLKRTNASRQEGGRAALLRSMSSVGGVDGFVELGEIEGDGTMQWMTSTGSNEQWSISFNKRPGRDITTTFKSSSGQCTASIVVQMTKQDCRGELKNSGEKIAEQATTLFLSYQMQDVLNALLKRPLMISETDENRIESRDAKDSYVLTLNSDGFPATLLYTIGSGDPIQVQYSNYLKLMRGWYPGKVSVGRVDANPTWVFTLKSVRGKSIR
jgi:hypothetical protein